ncbi:hypothetical protein BDW60DRAFT_209793 [Aspergillus nidulans var. acristatus]
MDISTAQTLLLLGWHRLQLYQTHRTLSYIQLAAQTINHLRGCVRETPNTGLYRSQINGFQIVDVEHEVLQNMDSVISSLRLWMLLQTKDGHPPVERLGEIPASFPRVDVLSSRMTALDIASGHGKNAALHHSKLPSTNICSNVNHPAAQSAHGHPGHVYILAHSYSKATRSHEIKKSHPKRTIYISCISWLATGSTKNRYAVESTSASGRRWAQCKRQGPAAPSRAIVEVTYLTVMIHMPFPHGHADNWALTGYVLCDFLTEAASLLNAISSFTRDNPSLKADAAGCFTTAAEIFALGLGICVRAMQYISSRQLIGSETEQDLITTDSAGMLDFFCKCTR